VDLFEQAMWYKVVWHLLASDLRQGDDSCTNQQAPPRELETRVVRHSKIFPLFEIINSGSDHYPFIVMVWGIYGGSWGVGRG
jgi:hypothetical protein